MTSLKNVLSFKLWWIILEKFELIIFYYFYKHKIKINIHTNLNTNISLYKSSFVCFYVQSRVHCFLSPRRAAVNNWIDQRGAITHRQEKPAPMSIYFSLSVHNLISSKIIRCPISGREQRCDSHCSTVYFQSFQHLWCFHLRIATAMLRSFFCQGKRCFSATVPSGWTAPART